MNPGTGRGHPAARSPAAVGLHLPCRRERIEGPLHGACAGAQRKRQRRARPRLAVGEERDYCRMLVFDGRCEHDNFAGLTRRQRKPSGRRAHVSRAIEPRPEAARFQPATVRDAIRLRALPGMPALRARLSTDLRAKLQRAHVQARTTLDALRARPPCPGCGQHDGTRPRRVTRTVAAASTSSIRRSRSCPCAIRRAAGVWRARNALSTSASQCRDSCLVRGALGPGERSARHLAPNPSHRNPRNHQFVGGSQSGRERGRIKPGERTLGLVETPDQEKTADRKMPRVPGVDPVAVLFERRTRRVERLRRPA